MSEPELRVVVLTLCGPCLDGEGGECHTPGCAMWLNRAPDLSLRERAEIEMASWRMLPVNASGWRPRPPTAAEFAARRGRLWGTRDSTGEVTFWRYDHDPWPNLSTEWRPYSDNYDPESWPIAEAVGRD